MTAKHWLWLFAHGFKLRVLSVVGSLPSHFFRRAAYRALGMRLGRQAVVYGGAEIRNPKGIEIGEGSIVGNRAILDGRMGIRIGKNVNLSTGVWIWTVQHDYRDSEFGDTGGAVEIGDRAWISCRAIILPGVRIGEGAVVAAGAVVTSEVAPYTVVGGVPAKHIADRPRDLSYELGRSPPIPFI